MPRPWCRSSTRKATSASPGSTTSYLPMAIIWLPSSTTSATRSRWSTCVNRWTSLSDSVGIGVKKRKYFDSSETRP